MIFSLQTKLILSSLMILACRAQDDSEATSPSPSPRLISNQNSAALTAGALGLGIGVAGSLIVSKLIDDAAKCKPPAISKLFPLPDLLKFNPVNPDCNKKFSQTPDYREIQPGQYPSQYPNNYPSNNPSNYPSQYPSQGYEVVPLSTFSQTAYQPAPVDLTPTFSYSQSSTSTTTAPVKLASGFSQTSSYNPQPNQARPSYPSPSSSHYQPEVSFVPNPAIQPRGLSDLFSPVSPAQSSQSAQFSQTEAVISEVDSFRTGKALEERPVLFQPLTRKELNKKSNGDSGFSQTEAVIPEVDSFRTGKALEAQPVLFQPVTKKQRNQKSSSGFSQTEAVTPSTDHFRNIPEVDSLRTGKALEDGPVQFQPVTKKQRNQKVASSSGFSQTEAVTPATDHFRNGKTLNSDAVVVEGREIETFNQRLVKNQGFSETEAIVAEPDVVRTAKQLNTNAGVRQVLFRPVAQDKLPRRGKTLSEPKSEPKPFTKSLSGLEHPVSAVADFSLSEPELHSHSRPQTFSGGL